MCGRYFVAPGLAGRASLQAFFAQAKKRAAAQQLQIAFEGEVRPGDIAAAIANDRSRQPSGFPMRWGMRRRHDTHGLVINARCETAAARPLFAESTRRHRCLLPASWYFEWAGDQAHTRWAFGFEDGSPCYLAGLYGLPDKAVDKQPQAARFVILTRDATPELARVHGRMPVIIAEDDAGKWLDLERPYVSALALATTGVTAREG